MDHPQMIPNGSCKTVLGHDGKLGESDSIGWVASYYLCFFAPNGDIGQPPSNSLSFRSVSNHRSVVKVSN
jgi:hypothetical protein